MCPDVPFVGWDVVLCPDSDVPGGMCILEVNLSCNFFRGKYDEANWWDFVAEALTDLDEMGKGGEAKKGERKGGGKDSRKRASSRKRKGN